MFHAAMKKNMRRQYFRKEDTIAAAVRIEHQMTIFKADDKLSYYHFPRESRFL